MITVVTTPVDPANPETDYIMRRRLEAAATVDPTDTYTTETVRTTFGPKEMALDVVVKYAVGHDFGPNYVFAVFADNPGFHRRPENEWNTVAGRALEKFAALHGRTVKLGPLVESGRPLNWFIEMLPVVSSGADNG